MKHPGQSQQKPAHSTASSPRFGLANKQRVALGVAAVILLTFLAYLPSLPGVFVWDDDVMLTRNPLIRASDGLYRFWFTTEPPDYFPLTSTTFWLEWRLWGQNPLGYRLFNILLHAVNAVLVWWILRRLEVPGAFWAGLLFTLHPVNVASVAWITERKNTLSMLFYLLSLLLYLRFEKNDRRSLYISSLGLFVLGLLSKTSVVMLPVVLILCAWWQRRRIGLRDLMLSAPFWAASLVLGLVTLWFQTQRAMAGEVPVPAGLWTRALGASRAAWFYLCKTVVPIKLSMIYPAWEINSARLLSYLPLLALLGSLALAWRFRRSWGCAVLFGGGYVLATLFPVLGFFPMAFAQESAVADHWQYLAIGGTLGLLTGLVAHGIRDYRVLRIPLAGVIFFTWATILLGLTLSRAAAYRDPVSFWNNTLASYPKSWLAHNNLGYVLANLGKMDDAGEHFAEALRIRPGNAEAYFNLGLALAAQGKMDDAIAQYNEALRLWPRYASGHYSLGVALAAKERYDQAVSHFKEALSLQPDFELAHYKLAMVLERLGRREEAIVHYRESVRIKPDLEDAMERLADALGGQGRVEEAVARYRDALRFRPNRLETLNNLAWILATNENATVRDGNEAVRFAQRACEIVGSGDPNPRDTLAAAYAEAGRFVEAMQTQEKALALAVSSKRDDLIPVFQSRLELYRSSRPYREKPSQPAQPTR